MNTQNPSDKSLELTPAQRKWAQTLHKAINGGLDMGIPQTKDSSGNYNTFLPGNNDGVLIRISPNGSTDNKYAWGATSTGIAINHTLLRQPVGAHLVSSNKDLRIWQTATPTVNTITIAPSDNSAYATIYIF